MGGEGGDVDRATQLAHSVDGLLHEGLYGLYCGTTLALVGASNGSLQFMTDEQTKSWAFERKWRQCAELRRACMTDDDKLIIVLHDTHTHTR